MKQWAGAFAVIGISVVIIAGISWSSGGSFGARALYVIAGLLTVAISVGAPMIMLSNIGKRKGESDPVGYVIAGGLLGFFVIMPIALAIVFKFLNALLHR